MREDYRPPLSPKDPNEDPTISSLPPYPEQFNRQEKISVWTTKECTRSIHVPPLQQKGKGNQ